jgi:hypothetical protein
MLTKQLLSGIGFGPYKALASLGDPADTAIEVLGRANTVGSVDLP